MIQVFCEKCRKELNEPGAIVVGPPTFYKVAGFNIWLKTHLCVECYKRLLNWFEERP